MKTIQTILHSRREAVEHLLIPRHPIKSWLKVLMESHLNMRSTQMTKEEKGLSQTEVLGKKENRRSTEDLTKTRSISIR